MKDKKKKNSGQIALNIAFIIIAITYIAPLMMIVSASFTSEQILKSNGFGLWPKEVSLDGYKAIFGDTTQVVQSYLTTITFSGLGTFLGVLIMGLTAYPLARKSFALKKPLNFFFLFTMLFSGGLVPSYILNVQYLHLNNTIWIYILPGLVSAYYLFVIRAGYRGIPEELIEAAKVDGASEFFICFRIIMPLAKASLATIAFMTLVTRWNEWYTASVYITDPKLYSLQYLLQKVMGEVNFMQQMVQEGMAMLDLEDMMPVESLRYAIAVVAAGPMLVVFPFFQKYFVKGMTVGAVKG